MKRLCIFIFVFLSGCGEESVGRQDLIPGMTRAEVEANLKTEIEVEHTAVAFRERPTKSEIEETIWYSANVPAKGIRLNFNKLDRLISIETINPLKK
jgi:hypothetical protein